MGDKPNNIHFHILKMSMLGGKHDKYGGGMLLGFF
jgi:hypothetical protein